MGTPIAERAPAGPAAPARPAGRLDEGGIDHLLGRHVRLQEARLLGRRLDVGEGLGGEITGQRRLVLGQRIVFHPVEGAVEVLDRVAHRLGDDGATARHVGVVVLDGVAPALDHGQYFPGLGLEHLVADHQHVADQPGIVAGGKDHVHALVLRHRGRKVRLGGHGHRHLAGDEGAACVGGRHRHRLHVGDRQAVLVEGVFEQDVAGGPLLERHLLALEIGDRVDLLGGDDGVGGHRDIEQQHDLDR